MSDLYNVIKERLGEDLEIRVRYSVLLVSTEIILYVF